MLLCTAFRLVSTTFDILGCIVEMTNILKLFYKLHTVSSLHKSYVTNYAPAHLTSIVIQAMHCWNIVAFSSSNSRICFIIISDEPHYYTLISQIYLLKLLQSWKSTTEIPRLIILVHENPKRSFAFRPVWLGSKISQPVWYLFSAFLPCSRVRRGRIWKPRNKRREWRSRMQTWNIGRRRAQSLEFCARIERSRWCLFPLRL